MCKRLTSVILVLTCVAALGCWLPGVGVFAAETNLAQGRPTSASSFQNDAGGSFLPAYAADGNAATRWTAVDNSVPSYWTVDLGEISALTSVDIAWFQTSNANPERWYAYTIAVSNDNVSYLEVIDQSDNTTNHINTHDVLPQGTVGRYVKITITGTHNDKSAYNPHASFWECAVNGYRGGIEMTQQMAISGFAAGGTATADVTAVSHIGDTEGMLLLALYNQNGTMTDLAYASATLLDGSEESISVSLPTLPDDLTGYYARAYLWDGFAAMQAYEEPAVSVGAEEFPQAGEQSDVHTASVDNATGLVSVSGKFDPTVAGQKVTLEVFRQGKGIGDIQTDKPETVQAALLHLYQTNADSEGYYTFQFQLDDGCTSGVYPVRIGVKDIPTAVETSFRYANPNDTVLLITAINDAQTIQDVMDACTLYRDALGFDFPLFDTLADKNAVYQSLVDAPQFDVGQADASINGIRDILKKATVLQAVNEAPAADALVALLAEHHTLMGLDDNPYYVDHYDQSGEQYQSDVCGHLLEARPQAGFDSADAFVTVFDQSVTVQSFVRAHDWGEIDSLLHAMNDTWTLQLDAEKVAQYDGLKDKSKVAAALLDQDLVACADIREQFYAALDAALDAQDRPQTGGTTSTSSSGGGGSRPHNVVINQPQTPEPDVPTTPTTPDAVTFSDLDGYEWAQESIEALAEKHIIEGYDGMFHPDSLVTREEFVKMLIESFAELDEAAVCSFSDVPANAWFYPYIASAEKLGLINGTENGIFGVGSYLTRADMAVMAYRFATFGGVHLASEREPVVFADDEAIAAYARAPVAAMQQANIIHGMGDGTFAPDANTTRAQAAVILDRLLQSKAAPNNGIE